MSQQLMDLVEKTSMKEEPPQFEIGDTIDVHTKILEGEKERIQVFNGVVIARRGSGTRETFTVRRIVQGEGRRAQVSAPLAAHRQGRRQTTRRRPARQTLLPARSSRQSGPAS